jgi:ABC-type multidrug transport system fused ATPase/permease subunit
MIATALLTQRLFDGYMFAGARLDGLVSLSVGLLAVATTAAALRAWEHIESERLGQSFVRDARLRLFGHWHRLDARALQRRGSGSVMLRFINDMTAIRQWISLGLARLAVSLVMIAGTLAVLALLSPWIATLVACTGALGLVASILLGGRLEDAVRSARRDRARLASNVAEKTAAMVVIQAHGQYRREARKLAGQSDTLVRAMVRRAGWIGTLRAVADATVRVTTVGVLAFGAWAVSQSVATPGSIVAALSVVALLMPSIRELGRVHEYWKSAVVAREQAQSFLASGPVLRERRQARPLPDGQGEVRFCDVTISPVTEPFSRTVPPGAHIAITGPNGAGKSTLLWLAARLIDPDSGRIEIDGEDIARVRTASLRRAVGIVSSDLPMLRGSIRRNLLYRRPDADDEEYRRVWRLCELDSLLDSLPRGIDTRLAHDARNLSGGERVRLALARALLGQPRLLLLDEADAHLDSPTRALLQRLVCAYPGTVLMATRHPDLIAAADEVWEVGDGRVRVATPAPGSGTRVVDFRSGTPA